MDRFQNTIEKIRTRNRYRYNNDQEIMKTYHSKQKLTWWLVLTLIWLDGVLCGQLLSLF